MQVSDLGRALIRHALILASGLRTRSLGTRGVKEKGLAPLRLLLVVGFVKVNKRTDNAIMSGVVFQAQLIQAVLSIHIDSDVGPLIVGRGLDFH